MGMIENKVIEFTHGAAVGIVPAERAIGTEGGMVWTMKPWPITHLSITKGLVEGIDDEVPLGSDDGKHFRILFGLIVDGKNVNFNDLYGKSLEQIAKILG